jgi:hypothetical protein
MCSRLGGAHPHPEIDISGCKAGSSQKTCCCCQRMMPWQAAQFNGTAVLQGFLVFQRLPGLDLSKTADTYDASCDYIPSLLYLDVKAVASCWHANCQCKKSQRVRAVPQLSVAVASKFVTVAKCKLLNQDRGMGSSVWLQSQHLLQD